MLAINLQQIIADINARRNRVKYDFQELGLMLSDKLRDPRHKALYMKLAKYEEQELLMDALHYVLASPNASGNVGALFMWKLKELKNRPLQPITVRYDIMEGYLAMGVISQVTRGDMPILLAGVTQFQQEYDVSALTIKVVSAQWAVPEASQQGVLLIMKKLPLYIKEFLSDFERHVQFSLYSRWAIHKNGIKDLPEERMTVQGLVKLSAPVLTKREFVRKMPPR